ncbi:MAG: hypothetical protein QM756_30805 [Polyangiaceae bacterium]
MVANSDFDLQYNAGTLNVLDVTKLRGVVPQPCASDDDCALAAQGCGGDAQCAARVHCEVGSGLCAAEADAAAAKPCGLLGERPLSEQLLQPGRCEAIDPSNLPSATAGAEKQSLLVSEVQIGAFATDVLYRKNPLDPSAGGRAFVPVRGDATLHWVEVSAEGVLSCGQSNDGGACDDLHRAGNRTDESSRELRLNPEPFAIDASPSGEAVLVTNQTTGTVSLFVNDWDPSEGPGLQFAVTGLPQRPVGVAALPIPAYSAVRGDYFPPGFLIGYRSAPQVDLIRYYDDQARTGLEASSVPRPYAARTNSVGIYVNSVGVDSRGIAVDPSARTRAEQDCQAQFVADKDKLLDCLRDRLGDAARRVRRQSQPGHAAARPHAAGAYGARSRRHSQLLRQRRAHARGPRASCSAKWWWARTRAARTSSNRACSWFASIRDASSCTTRRVAASTPKSTPGAARTPSPSTRRAAGCSSAISTDSFISVVSLDRRFPQTYAKTLAMIGTPTAPRASK